MAKTVRKDGYVLRKCPTCKKDGYMPPEQVADFDFWGECKSCRLHLPICTNQLGDQSDSGAGHDRVYNGGTDGGEW